VSAPEAGVPEGVPPSRTQRLIRVVVLGALVVVPLVVRVACEAQGELDAAAHARAEGDEDGEVVHLGRALRWRLPLASFDERALDRLVEIGDAAEARGDTPAALAAFREIRSALLGSRGLDVPHADRLGDIDLRIAALMAADADERTARHDELRVESERPRGGLFAAAAAFVAWAWVTMRLLLVGIDGRGRLVPGSGVRLGLAALALLVSWMVLWRWA
jgi:hypothetical protein